MKLPHIIAITFCLFRIQTSGLGANLHESFNGEGDFEDSTGRIEGLDLPNWISQFDESVVDRQLDLPNAVSLAFSLLLGAWKLCFSINLLSIVFLLGFS